MSEFVSKWYTMNPASEDLLFMDQLQNGMVVLVANLEWREDTDNLTSTKDVANAMRANRWCTVTNLSVSDDYVRFIGVHEDGTKYVRWSDRAEGWLVKLDSIPASPYNDFHGESEVDKRTDQQIAFEYAKKNGFILVQPRKSERACPVDESLVGEEGIRHWAESHGYEFIPPTEQMLAHIASKRPIPKRDLETIRAFGQKWGTVDRNVDQTFANYMAMESTVEKLKSKGVHTLAEIRSGYIGYLIGQGYSQDLDESRPSLEQVLEYCRKYFTTYGESRSGEHNEISTIMLSGYVG